MTREEAIDILKHDISADKQGIEYCHDEVGIEALDMAIKALEQEPKAGHWVDGDRTRWKCSNCGYGVLDWNNTPYCPNCGARMVEPQESEE